MVLIVLIQDLLELVPVQRIERPKIGYPSTRTLSSFPLFLCASPEPAQLPLSSSCSYIQHTSFTNLCPSVAQSSSKHTSYSLPIGNSWMNIELDSAVFTPEYSTSRWASVSYAPKFLRRLKVTTSQWRLLLNISLSWKSEIFRDNVVVGFLRCIDVPQLPYLL